MKKKDSKAVVVDANIARSSSFGDHPLPTQCRELMESIRDICHKMVLTPYIAKEWNKHQSNFAIQWRSSMNAKKKIVHLTETEDEDIRKKIKKYAKNDKKRKIMLKDVPLLEAAIAADGIVFSKDDEARDLFKNVSLKIKQIKPVRWINPAEGHNSQIEWLKKGAKPGKKWRLDS